MSLLYRFLIGGLFVSFFAVLGDSLKPKTFAGLFGAAEPWGVPVALALAALGWLATAVLTWILVPR
jgi:hypothetical protein